MKISTYNTDGSLSDEKSINVQVPDYITHFDASQHFFVVCEDEVNIFNSKAQSFCKSLLFARLFDTLEYDIQLYKDSQLFNKYRNLIEFYDYATSSQSIILGDKELTKLLRSYGSKSNLNDGNCTSDCESTTWENLLSKEWMDFLLFHAMRSSLKNLKAVDMPAAILTSLLNLISKYYSALSRFSVMYKKSDAISMQMTVLRPFIGLNRCLYNPMLYNKSLLIQKTLNSLLATNFTSREDIYKLILLIDMLSRSTTNEYLQFLQVTSIQPENKVYTFILDDFAKRPSKKFELTDAEIISIRIPGNELTEKLRDILLDIYSEHLLANKNKFENNLQTEADNYSIDNGDLDSSTAWKRFKSYHTQNIMKASVGKNDFEPEECYYNILLNNDNPNALLSFHNKDIVADLFDVLKENSSQSQYTLYKGMYSLNYIKEKIGISPTDATTQAIKKAEEYLKPLYSSKFNEKGEKLETIVTDFFSLAPTRHNITNVMPEGFNGGFNLVLVYNFIGMLITKGFLKSRSGKAIDKHLCDNAYEKDNGFIKAERRHYINDGKSGNYPLGSYIKDIENLLEQYK